ncbi:MULTISPECIES: DedA family protein [unclassified Devosia]|uniref:DedA family protein n=1 Tax=unclassified Devosia TaxID=196773 RepID=UPI0025D25333|nr:DedA family protein [Devosia sp.]MCR6636274.1 DedA family protein [Devosia sp.]
MIEFLHSVSVWLETLLNAVSDNFWLSIGFIFLVAIGEAVFILGLFVPSTPVLLLVGGIIATGKLPFWEIYLAAVVGAVIGDAISYTVGFALKDRIKTIWPFRNYLELLSRGEVFFAKHGGKSVFIGRFIPGVKAVVPGIAGMMGMPYRWFTIINVSSAFAWAAAHILPGMLLTAWLKSIGLSLELVIIVGAAVLTVLFLLIHYFRSIVLVFAPFMGGFGRSLQARWGRSSV